MELTPRMQSLLEDGKWDDLSCQSNLPIDFIRYHADRLNWYWLSIFQKLPEDLLDAHFGEISRFWVTSTQTLSHEFIEKHRSKLVFKFLAD